jgi:hypothetical protein
MPESVEIPAPLSTTTLPTPQAHSGVPADVSAGTYGDIRASSLAGRRRQALAGLFRW